MSFETAPLSKTEVDYPAIRAMHEASSLENEAEVVDWRSQALENPSDISWKSESPISKERLIPLQPPGDERFRTIPGGGHPTARLNPAVLPRVDQL